MSLIDKLPQVVSEQNRRSVSAFKRGYHKGKQDANQYSITQLEGLLERATEFEIRKELPGLIRHLKEQE